MAVPLSVCRKGSEHVCPDRCGGKQHCKSRYAHDQWQKKDNKNSIWKLNSNDIGVKCWKIGKAYLWQTTSDSFKRGNYWGSLQENHQAHGFAGQWIEQNWPEASPAQWVYNSRMCLIKKAFFSWSLLRNPKNLDADLLWVEAQVFGCRTKCEVVNIYKAGPCKIKNDTIFSTNAHMTYERDQPCNNWQWCPDQAARKARLLYVNVRYIRFSHS